VLFQNKLLETKKQNGSNLPRLYRAFHIFGQAKFPDGGLVLGSSRFLILTQLPLKMTLDLKVVKINSKIIILLHKSKSVTHSVQVHTVKAYKNFQKKLEFLHFSSSFLP